MILFCINTKKNIYIFIQARLAQEEKEALARSAEQALNEKRQLELLKEKREQYIRYLYANLPEEPADNTSGKVAKLSFRLANGDRVIRKFNQNDTVDVSYHIKIDTKN